MYPHPTQQQFFQKLNKIDKEKETDLYVVACFAITGFIIGIVAGYFIGCWLPMGG